MTDQEEEQLPPGFRFHPTDDELITYYLKKKITEASFCARAIAEVDLNKCEPWDLPGKARMGEEEWYFFSLRDRKYPTGVRTNRATNAGYWKTTGKDREIFSSNIGELVGMKKTLVFYKGRAPRGEKTLWIMHEYRLHSNSAFFFRANKDEWVVCRVIRKSPAGCKKYYPSNQHRNLEMIPPIMELSIPVQYGVHGFNLQPIQPHLNYKGNFTYPPPPLPLPPPLSRPPLVAEPSPSSLLTCCIMGVDDGGLSPDIAGSAVAGLGPMYRTFDTGLELEGYWPSC